MTVLVKDVIAHTEHRIHSVLALHCVIYHQQLALKRMSHRLTHMLDEVVTIVNSTKARPFNSRLSSIIYTDMGNLHTPLLLHMAVC
jgi:hypothetical protein